MKTTLSLWTIVLLTQSTSNLKSSSCIFGFKPRVIVFTNGTQDVGLTPPRFKTAVNHKSVI